MKVMSELTKQGVFVLILLTLINGCTNHNDPISSEVSKEIISLATAPISESSLVNLTLDEVKRTLSIKMTQEEVEATYGDHYKVEQSSLYWASDWVPDEVWSYTDDHSSATLQLHWSQEGRMQYAVFYDRDAQGNVRSYLPAQGALEQSSSGDNSLAAKYGLQIGQTIQVHASTLGYDLISSSEPMLAYMAVPLRSVRITAIADPFVEVDDDGVRAWILVWYFTPEAKDIRDVIPVRITIKKDMQAYWYPQSSAVAINVIANENVYALRSYGDWVGIAVPSDKNRPELGLVWIRKEQIADGEMDWQSVYTDANISPEMMASVVRSELQLGQSKQRVERIFGAPKFMEASDNIEQPGKLKTLTVWRYENAFSQLLLTWSDDHTLLNYRYRTESVDFGNDSLFTIQEPARIKKEWGTETNKPLAATKKIAFDWRVTTELPFNYLIGEAGDILLVAGEDNGFSGFHEASHLYGLDRNTGATVWKYDFGHGLHEYALSVDRHAIVFYQGSENESGGVSYRLQAMDTRSGKPLWNKQVNQSTTIDNILYTVSGATAVLSFVRNEGEKQTTYLESRDIRNGRLLWNKKIEGAGRLLKQNSKLPAIVVETGSDLLVDAKLTAYHPQTGKKLWELKERLADMPWDNLLTVDNRFTYGKLNGYWTRGFDQLTLIDAATGKTLISLPLSFEYGTHYDGINEQFIFQQQSQDGEKLYDSEDIVSSLIDLRTGKAVWSVQGKADRGMIEGGILYYCLDGKPRAVDLTDGNIIWESEWVIRGMMEVFGDTLIVEGIPDVYLLNKTTGKVKNRMHDVRVGYHEVTPDEQIYGVLTVRGKKLYLGSSNGYFGRITSVDQ